MSTYQCLLASGKPVVLYFFRVPESFFVRVPRVTMNLYLVVFRASPRRCLMKCRRHLSPPLKILPKLNPDVPRRTRLGSPFQLRGGLQRHDERPRHTRSSGTSRVQSGESLVDCPHSRFTWPLSKTKLLRQQSWIFWSRDSFSKNQYFIRSDAFRVFFIIIVFLREPIQPLYVPAVRF